MSLTAPAAPSSDQLWARLNGTCEQLWTAVHTLVPRQPGQGGLSMEVVHAIDSTNSELMRRARQGQTDPTLLVAISQTAGRGRMGKAWQSTAGASLTFSLGLPLRPADWSGLSLAVGVSVADSLDALLAQRALTAPLQPLPTVQLKWPNDLWMDGKKVAGILIETAHAGDSRFVVIGIGINITPPPELPAPPQATPGSVALPPTPPTGLAAFAHPLDAADALASLLPGLVADALTFEAHGFSAFASRFASRDALANQPLLLSDGTQGTGQGVDATGALQVLTAHGMRVVNSAEVSVRPVVGGLGSRC